MKDLGKYEWSHANYRQSKLLHIFDTFFLHGLEWQGWSRYCIRYSVGQVSREHEAVGEPIRCHLQETRARSPRVF